jgi:hypothetical protein
MNDLLDDWQATFHPPFEGIRVIGNRWSPHSHQAKDFLARNQVPISGWTSNYHPKHSSSLNTPIVINYTCPLSSSRRFQLDAAK